MKAQTETLLTNEEGWFRNIPVNEPFIISMPRTQEATPEPLIGVLLTTKVALKSPSMEDPL